jgi:hypothetical protein
MRIGILIVGSLYWDSLAVRAAWRANRLKLGDVAQVTAPIRYGRLSISRANTYTMVFSQLCSAPERLGTGLVVGAAVKCRKPDDLLVEAQHLWAAERNVQEVGPVSASWGRVGLLVSPSAEVAEEYLEGWQTFPGRKRRPAPVAPNERPVIDEETGLALIDWPIDKRTKYPLDGYDLLLLTATSPTLNAGNYPTTEEIATAWRHDPNGHVTYFHNNRNNGITTFQDDEITRLLKLAD